MLKPKRFRIEDLEQRRLLTVELIPLHTFGPIEKTPVVESGEASAAAQTDINNDGILDIVFGSAHRRYTLTGETSDVGVALGDGMGGFQLAARLPIHDDAHTLVAADLNQDGFDDVVSGGVFRLSIFLSQVSDDGEWLGLSEPTYIGGASDRVVVADLNGNGRLDIATAAVYHGFQWVDPNGPAPTERNLSNVSIYAGDGEGGFASPVRYPGQEQLLAIDYDNDGDIDLITQTVLEDAIAFSQRQYSVLLNESAENISFVSGPLLNREDFSALVPEVTFDLNGDPYPDKISSRRGNDTTGETTETVYYLGKPDGEFEPPVHMASLNFRRHWEFGFGRDIMTAADPFVYDVDGNGQNDFVHVQYGSILIVRQGNLKGFSTVAQNYPSLSDKLVKTRFWDINGDGYLDFLAESGGFNSSVVLGYVQKGQPGGGFGEAYIVESNVSQMIRDNPQQIEFVSDELVESISPDVGDWAVLDYEDIDGDSDFDLFLFDRDWEWSFEEPRRRYFSINQGDGDYSQAEVYVGPHDPITFHTDFGYWRNPVIGGVSVTVPEESSHMDSNSWRADVAAKFQIPIPSEPEIVVGFYAPYHDAKQVDVDGDGDLDILVGHGSGVAVVLAVGPGDFDMDGSVTSADHAMLRSAWQSGAADSQLDLNADGQLDILDEEVWIEDVAKSKSGDLNLDGSVDFTDFLILSVNYRATDAMLGNGDVNGDQVVDDVDLELMLENFGYNKAD